MTVNVPKPEETLNGKINTATEIAFAALRAAAEKQGLNPLPVMGLMYLPKQEDTRAFRVGCRAALSSMGIVYETDPDDAPPSLAVVGAKVMLKSGGPEMTVVYSEQDAKGWRCVCTWKDDDQCLSVSGFAIETLVAAGS